MLIQIAVLAWIFLDEPIGPRQIAGLVLAAVGSAAVQLLRTLDLGYLPDPGIGKSPH